jgi:hypothetical protein
MKKAIAVKFPDPRYGLRIGEKEDGKDISCGKKEKK